MHRQHQQKEMMQSFWVIRVQQPMLLLILRRLYLPLEIAIMQNVAWHLYCHGQAADMADRKLCWIYVNHSLKHVSFSLCLLRLSLQICFEPALFPL